MKKLYSWRNIYGDPNPSDALKYVADIKLMVFFTLEFTYWLRHTSHVVRTSCLSTRLIRRLVYQTLIGIRHMRVPI